jgi:DNA replication protein DnaC
MNINELQKALVSLRLSGMAAVIETRLLQAQAEKSAYVDVIAALVNDELTRRADRLIARRVAQAAFRDVGKTIDTFDFDFNKKMNRKLIFELATTKFVHAREDVLLLGPPGTGKSHLAQAFGHAALVQGHRVVYREAHALVLELAEAHIVGKREATMQELATAPLLIIDDLGMRKLPATAAEDLLELVMRRYERHSTVMTSNRPVEDWGKVLGDVAATSAMLDRLLHHCHVLTCGPRSYRTKAGMQADRAEA